MAGRFEDSCRELGGHLATIKDEADYDKPVSCLPTAPLSMCGSAHIVRLTVR